MLKMYHSHAETGGSVDYWEAFGSEGTLDDRLRFCEVDPLRPLFLRYVKPGAVMLEGGCGRGQYVAYYGSRGAKVIGLDFAREWLRAARSEMPSLKLCAGDVAALPFPDASFDVYYSGGVVEHFEGGADRALAEARRVLKRDGILLISVPYYSPLRGLLRFVRHRQWRKIAAPRVDGDVSSGGRFYQYAYTIPEFQRFLADAGLRVIDTQGYAILWGLYDIAWVQWIADRLKKWKAACGEPPGSRNSAGVPRHGAGRSDSLLKRLLVSEDDGIDGVGWVIRVSRRTCANMMMYICTPASAAIGGPLDHVRMG